MENQQRSEEPITIAIPAGRVGHFGGRNHSHASDQRADLLPREKRSAGLWIAAWLALFGPVAFGAEQADADRADRITQVSVINGLMLGEYDGFVSIKDLLGSGDFGLGTLDRLDGELIVLDGAAYQARSSGEVVAVPPAATTPFAAITPFETDGTIPCPELASLERLDQFLDERLQERNNFVAIRIEAGVASITLRSVPAQEKPYKPLQAIARSQPIWTHRSIRGSFVGIRSPQWARDITVPGYHWHFISTDRRIGGHVLDCQIQEGTIRYDICGDWTVKLDRSAAFNDKDLSGDLRDQVKQVESLRGEFE